MFTLHIIDSAESLADATVSIGIMDPNPPGERLHVYDFGLMRPIWLKSSHLLAVATGTPARTSFASRPEVEAAEMRMVANPRKVIAFPRRRKRPEIPTNFVSGYDRYARGAAERWRRHGVGTQPLLAAGVFSLSSIQVPIKTALRLFELLTPHVLVDALPSTKDLVSIVRESGAGLDSPKTGRPAWYRGYEEFRTEIHTQIADGLRDDDLRWWLATSDMPRGLGLAKLSFTLALVGNNLGCLDARILEHAFTPKMRKRFMRATSKTDSRYSQRAYDLYRTAELQILRDTPFYDPDDPVALARSQWLLWESLGPEAARTHTHEELFAAVVEQ